ncbi:Hpt domain-containing protein [Maricaulis sp.]|uniref:Hpt domain-containing protein n=1 Tax=Maricaulis sp. TaxID=1486257 RepID=UPI002622D7E3|nr:Hpt domain-containing protein [Maricaulis sp.]
MSDWRSKPDLDDQIVSTLIAAVGSDAFVEMRGQFIDDLKNLRHAYKEEAGRGDTGSASQTAHALKGAAANIGLVRLSSLAAILEAGDTAAAVDLDTVFEAAVGCLEDAG